MKVLGLMSGTSADGVDAVLVDFNGRLERPSWRIKNCISIPYELNLRQKVIQAGQGLKMSSNEWLDLAEEITEVNASVALACDPFGEAEIIGCHGQTVWHRPPTSISRGASWQLIQAPLLAKLLDRTVVFDFRGIDLAYGGQGAPLVPVLDEALLGRIGAWRAVLNLGGISNLTLIPPNKGPDCLQNVVGWDCGPANTLIDLAIHKITNGSKYFDKDGCYAAKGIPNLSLIRQWLTEPYFQRFPPKSTGREQFGDKDLEYRLKQMNDYSIFDVIATLTTFTASIVANDLENLRRVKQIKPIEMLIAGGGVRNLVMIDELRKKCRGISIFNIDKYGIPALSREALTFALLAWWHINQYPGNSIDVTGAKKSVVLGVHVNPG